MTPIREPSAGETGQAAAADGGQTMRAAIWHGGDEFVVERRPLVPPPPGEVRVRVDSCGVCMTEVHGVEGLLVTAPPPRLMGHEYGGVVDAVGAGVVGFAPGTAVACAGREGYAEYGTLPAERVYPLPPGVPAEHAVFAEPLQCCLAAEQRAQVPLGATVLITGAGPMGLLLLQITRLRAGARVLVSDPNPARRALALELGAAVAVDPLDPHDRRVADVVHDLTGGASVAVAFEAAGNIAALGDCLGAVGEDGAVVLVGVSPSAAQLPLDVYPFHRRNLRLIGSYGDRAGVGFTPAVAWLGRLRLAPLISHRFDLDDIDAAFATARRGEGLKVLVRAR